MTHEEGGTSPAAKKKRAPKKRKTPKKKKDLATSTAPPARVVRKLSDWLGM